MAQSLKMINIAVANKTTIDFQKRLGQTPISASNGLIEADFQTTGWQQSFLILSFTNGGKNLTLQMDEKQAGDLLAGLNRAGLQGDDANRQMKLFQ